MGSLEKKAKEIRRKVFDIAYKTGKGHLGGTFSILDILVYMYYGNVIRFSQKGIKDLILIGKGHSCVASYVIWEDLGILDKKLLKNFGNTESLLGTQFDKFIPNSEYNTGSLGHVIGIGAGYSLALKLKKDNSRKIFIIVGDGECEEGSIWESIDFIVKNEINNLTIIVDRNRLSVTDFIKDDNLVNKFKSFGLDVLEIDGHNFSSILKGFITYAEKSKIIIADTIKGKGLSFLENDARSHNRPISHEEYKIGKKELND